MVRYISLAPTSRPTNRVYAGELGLGPDEPKSATKPTRLQPLIGVDIFQYVALRRRDLLFLMAWWQGSGRTKYRVHASKTEQQIV